MTTLPHSSPVIEERDCNATLSEWTIPPLHFGEIHVWRQKLQLAPPAVEEFRKLLSVGEQMRAQRFRFEEGRTEYLVSRGTLRVLLSAYQSIPLDQLQFVYSEYGRPSLEQQPNSEPIAFNISHSAGMTLLAFARHHRIGIDIEEVRQNFDPTEIAENFFSVSERTVLRELPADLRHQAFFRCWTRKEAFIKALGEGLSYPLDAFDVSLVPGEPPALLATRPNAREAARWALRDMAVPHGYVGALAVELEPATS